VELSRDKNRSEHPETWCERSVPGREAVPARDVIGDRGERMEVVLLCAPHPMMVLEDGRS
jgi:hypothetical protein